MASELSRRDLLAGAALGAGLAAGLPPASAGREKKPAFRCCLNTSTLRGHSLPLAEEVEIAAKAGYDAIEPWVREIEEHAKAGGSLKDLEKRIRDRGLTVESAIGF